MGVERLAPDAILEVTNLSGVVGDIQDDPDSSDGNWLTASGNNVNIDVRVSVLTPTGNPTVGADVQEFRVLLRQYDEGQGKDPEGRIELWENGALIRAGSDVSVPDGGIVVSFPWNASELGTPDGSLVEIKAVGTKSGGSPGNRNSVEVGAIEWNVVYDEAPVDVLISGTISAISGLTGLSKVDRKILGSISGISGISGLAKVARKVSGTISGISGVSGSVKVIRKIAGTISAVSTITGNAILAGADVLISGTISAISGLAGLVKVNRKVAGSISGVFGISGLTKVVRKVVGSISGISGVGGTTKVTRKISGQISGISSITGKVTGVFTLIGSISGISSIWGKMTKVGEEGKSWHFLSHLLEHLKGHKESR